MGDGVRPHGVRLARRNLRRAVTFRLFLSLAVLWLIALVFATVLGYDELRLYLRGERATATALPSPDGALSAVGVDDVEVTFVTAAGREVTTSISHYGFSAKPRPGSRLTVEYDPYESTAARYADDHGGLLAVGAAGALWLGLSAYGVRSVKRRWF